MRQLISAASDGLWLRDWHLGNVGFSDEVDSKMILVDWEGKVPGGAIVTPRKLTRSRWIVVSAMPCADR